MNAVNEAALAEAICRFPRVLARMSQIKTDFVRRIVLNSEPATVQAIVHEYRLIAGGRS